MNLPIIDYFANGPQTVDTGVQQDFTEKGWDTKLITPQQIKDYYELAELAIHFKERVGSFVEDALKGSVLKQWTA